MSDIRLRFHCREHGYVPAGFNEPIEQVFFNQRGELGLACPLCHKSRPMQLERGTGLLDKRGVEIYENDIVQWKIGSIKCVGVVAYGEYGSWNKGIPGKQMQSLGSYQKSTEIIGNVHNDQQLLEGK